MAGLNHGGRTVSCDCLCYVFALKLDNLGLVTVQLFTGSEPLLPNCKIKGYTSTIIWKLFSKRCKEDTSRAAAGVRVGVGWTGYTAVLRTSVIYIEILCKSSLEGSFPVWKLFNNCCIGAVFIKLFAFLDH